MSKRHTVIHGATGAILLSGASEAQFDRWYDHHSHFRKPHSLEEVRPDLRAAYAAADDCTHFLVEDAS